MCEAEGGWERRGVRGKPERPGHLGGGGGGPATQRCSSVQGRRACMNGGEGGGGPNVVRTSGGVAERSAAVLCACRQAVLLQAPGGRGVQGMCSFVLLVCSA